MYAEDRSAPSYATLRPLKPTRTKGFPVYPDLVERLVAAGEHPDPAVAHVLATCSGYAYSDTETVAMIMARLGLEDNACRMVAQSVDAMLIASTAYLVQSADGRVVILCYRGTVPTSAISWLTDVDINPHPVSVNLPDGNRRFEVHGGFYRNVRATRYEIVRSLDRALHGRSVQQHAAEMDHPMEALYVTGHSYGAAMASLMAIMLCTEAAYEPIAEKLRAAYTFGAPMIGDPELADACRGHPFLGRNVIRYVYDHDIVARLPPTAAGRFAHFGVEYQYKPAGGGDGTWQHNPKPRTQLRNLLDIVATPLTFLARQAQVTRDIRFQASTYDHLPAGYITALTPPGVVSEFGGE
jgi:hypothetical protein